MVFVIFHFIVCVSSFNVCELKCLTLLIPLEVTHKMQLLFVCHNLLILMKMTVFSALV